MTVDFANENDLKKISLLEEKCFLDFWSYNSLKTQFKSPNSDFIVAKNDNNIIGYAIFNHVCDELEILKICVDKRYRRKKVGTKMYDAILKECNKYSILYINLEVRSKNSEAILFYQNLGFSTVGVRKGYYAKYDNDNAVLMTKRL